MEFYSISESGLYWEWWSIPLFYQVNFLVPSCSRITLQDEMKWQVSYVSKINHFHIFQYFLSFYYTLLLEFVHFCYSQTILVILDLFTLELERELDWQRRDSNQQFWQFLPYLWNLHPFFLESQLFCLEAASSIEL